MFWGHELHRRRIEDTKQRAVTEGEFEAQLIAKRVDGSWFPELIPLYPYDERGEELDNAVAAMVQSPFDPSIRYASADECLEAAEDQFRAAAQQLVQSNESE